MERMFRALRSAYCLRNERSEVVAIMMSEDLGWEESGLDELFACIETAFNTTGSFQV